MNRLQSIRIKRFKRINDAAFDLKDVSVLVGANNSGKSSLIQGLHFGVGLLQTIALANKWPESSETFTTSLSPNQLIYCPSEDVYAVGPGGKLLADKTKAMYFEFTLDSGEQCSMSVSKGKNVNISVTVNAAQVAKRLSSLEQPFSIFSPGLAGIAKRENYVADGVLLRTLARGDANLVLRNILLRLRDADPGWAAFMEDIHDMFPELGNR